MFHLFIYSLNFLSSAFRFFLQQSCWQNFLLQQNSLEPSGRVDDWCFGHSSGSKFLNFDFHHCCNSCQQNYLCVHPAIPIIMGANIGTSVTNTLVSLAQATERNQFRRALSGAVVHDMFNVPSVVVFLLIEAACGYLYHLTSYSVCKMSLYSGRRGATRKRLTKIIKPFTNMIIQLDKKIITKIEHGNKSAQSKCLSDTGVIKE